MKGKTNKKPGVVWSARLDESLEKRLRAWAAQHRFLTDKSDILRGFLADTLPDKTTQPRKAA